MKRQIHFIFNNSEIGAGTRGASLGPEAIKAVARNHGDTIFSEIPLENIETYNELLDKPTIYTQAKNIDGLVKVYNNLNNSVSKCLKENKFPFVIAADHASAGGTIAGIKTAFSDKKLGVIWIDAHGDLHTPYTTPSGNLHGMPLATALGEDNEPCSKNEVKEVTADLWKELKNCGGIQPKITADNLIFIGVRDTENEEKALIERLGIHNFTVEDVNTIGPKITIESCLERLKDCDKIYVSFDVDSMDPALTSHGTGTPVDKGLTPKQASDLLCELAKNEKVCCIEFVEVNPCLDEKINKMAETAYELLKDVIQVINESQ